MSTSKNRTLVFIIAVLLLTNIAVLSYFLWFKKQPALVEASHERSRDSNGIETPLQKEVGFNEDQLSQYRQMRDDQRKMTKSMFEDMRKTRDSLFRLIGDRNIDDSIVSNIADEIALKQKTIDLRMFNYFKKVRELCTPDQQPKYDSLIQRMMRKMGRPHKDQDKKDAK